MGPKLDWFSVSRLSWIVSLEYKQAKDLRRFYKKGTFSGFSGEKSLAVNTSVNSIPGNSEEVR